MTNGTKIQAPALYGCDDPGFPVEIVARMEANGRKFAVVQISSGWFSPRDTTNGENGHPASVDGHGRVLGNPMKTVEWALGMCMAAAFPKSFQPERVTDRDLDAVRYFSGNERVVGAGPEGKETAGI